jgi:hypothetical protein
VTRKSGLAFVPHLPSPPYPATTYTQTVVCNSSHLDFKKDSFLQHRHPGVRIILVEIEKNRTAKEEI